MTPEERTRKSLELERIKYTHAIETINEEARIAEETAAADFSRRGLYHSGEHVSKIAQIDEARARKMIQQMIELRRETLRSAPEAATEASFNQLFQDADKTIERVLDSIPEHIRRRGIQLSPSLIPTRFQDQTLKLKASAHRDIEVMKREFELQTGQAPAVGGAAERRNAKRVFVVHGRNLAARDAMFAFVRAIGLEPIEWEEALANTGSATPYVGVVLERAFSEAQAVVVLVTGDDVARLGTRYVELNDGPDETSPTAQARPNVLFEAGMAFGRNPDRTVLVALGKTRPFSDVAGRHVLNIRNDVGRRQALAERLKTAGCEVTMESRSDWQTAGDFDAANVAPDHYPPPIAVIAIPTSQSLGRGWILAGSNPSTTPAFNRSTDSPVGVDGCVSIDTKGEFYAIDIPLEADQSLARTLAFFAKLSTEEEKVYAGIELTSKEGMRQSVEYFLEHVHGDQSMPPTRDYRTSNEFRIFIDGEVCGHGWRKYRLNLSNEVERSFGKEWGHRYSRLRRIRIRGSVSISPITLY